MVVDRMGAIKTGCPGFLNNLLEVAVIVVVENFCEVSTGSKLPARRIGAADKLEG